MAARHRAVRGRPSRSRARRGRRRAHASDRARRRRLSRRGHQRSVRRRRCDRRRGAHVELRLAASSRCACSSPRARAASRRSQRRGCEADRASGRTPPRPARRARASRRARATSQIRVEWKDVRRREARAPGPCGPPTSSPTTTWGIPETVVTLAGSARRAAPPSASARVVDRSAAHHAARRSSRPIRSRSRAACCRRRSVAFGDRPGAAADRGPRGHGARSRRAATTLVAGDSRAWVVSRAAWPRSPMRAASRCCEMSRSASTR